MKSEVTQHAVRLLDAIDTFKGYNERTYQLHAMTFFILAAKFHNRGRIRVCTQKPIFGIIFLIYLDGRIFTLFRQRI